MAIPDTNTFNLTNVTDELGLGNDESLTACFADAVSNKFDSTYNPNSDGTSNNLLNFRNYGASNTLVVSTTSSGGVSVAYVTNQSVNNQVVTFTWKYVSQTADISATVRYEGTVRSVGYTTPTITGNIDNSQGVGVFTIPFSLSGGNSAQLYFEFTLLTAATDTVPSSPNNKTTVGICRNCT